MTGPKRFSIGSSPLTAIRNRAFSTGLAKRDADPPKDPEQKQIYMVSYRRGQEAAARAAGAETE